MSVTSKEVPVDSCFFGRFFQDQRVDLDQAPYWLLSSVLGLAVISYTPFIREVCFQRPLALYTNPSDFQNQVLYGLIFLVPDPRAAEPDVRSDLFLLGENSFSNCDYHPVCGLCSQGVGLEYPVSLPFLPIFMRFYFFYIFSCEKYFLLVFRLFL